MRFVVTVENYGGGTSVYGPWRNGETADKIAAGLRARSSRYTATEEDLPDFSVSVDVLEKWPGYRVATGG